MVFIHYRYTVYEVIEEHDVHCECQKKKMLREEQEEKEDEH